MDETIKQNIMKIVIVVVMFILLLCTITTNSKYGKLESEVDGYKYEITGLEENIKEKDELIESYKKTQAEDKETITKLNETITELENKITTKDSQIKQLNNKVKELETQSNKYIEEITILQKDLKEKGDTIVFLNNSINDLNTKLTTSTTEITDLTTLTNNLNNKIIDIENRYNTINQYYVVNSEIELISAIENGGNIILNTDILMSNNIEIKNKYASIDLNGNNLVVLGIEVHNSTLEIKDNKLNPGKISIIGENDELHLGIKIDKESTLMLTNGKYEGKKLFQIEGTINIIGGQFTTAKEQIITTTENAIINEIGLQLA